jgi:hypothetical protein
MRPRALRVSVLAVPLILATSLLAAPARAEVDASDAHRFTYGFEAQCSVSRRAGCAAGPHVAWRFEYGELRVAFLEALPGGTRLLIGAELGTPYWPIGGPRSGFSFALRGEIDGLVGLSDLPGGRAVGLRASVGPSLRWALRDGSEITVRVGVGAEWLAEPGRRSHRPAVTFY